MRHRVRMIAASSLAIAAGLMLVLTSSAAARTAYVALQTPDTLQRVDTDTNTVIGVEIAAGNAANNVAITPNGATVYVTSIPDSTVTPVSTATNLAGTPIPVTAAVDVAVAPDGSKVYASSSTGQALFVIDQTTNTVDLSIPLGGSSSDIAITPDGTKAYVSLSGTSIRPVNLTSNTAGTAITVGTSPEGIGITPDGTKAFVANKDSDSVSVVNVATDSVSDTITTIDDGLVADPFSVAISPDGSRAYVANRVGVSSAISVINTTTNAVVGGPIPIGNFANDIALTPNGKQAFVTASGSNNVTKLDTDTLAPVPPALSLPATAPTGIAIIPNQGPTAALSAGPQPAGSATTFNGTASSDSDGSVTRFDWDFGDGDTLPNGGPTPSHAYDEAGTYNVTLTVTDNEGCSKTRIYTGSATLCNGGAAAEIAQQVVVAKATPTLSTSASPAVVIAGSVSDTATLSNGVATPGGTITFQLFGPDNATCAGAPAFTNTKNVTGNGNYTSDAFTPTAVGSYRWTAEYSGDDDNNAVTSPCNAPGESVEVGKVTPSLSTSACCSVALGSAIIRDTATLSGGLAPTGTITFRLFGPNDESCSRTPVLSSPRPVSGNGSVDSDQFIPTTGGTYRWTAEYSGDAQNAAVASPCNAEGESVVISDSTAPALTLGGSKKQKLDAAIEVDVSCDEPCTASGTGTLEVSSSGGGKKTLAKKTFKLRAASIDVGAGTTQTLSFKVPRKAKAVAAKALKGGGTVKAQLTVSASDASGNAAEAKRTASLTGGR